MANPLSPKDTFPVTSFIASSVISRARIPNVFPEISVTALDSVTTFLLVFSSFLTWDTYTFEVLFLASLYQGCTTKTSVFTFLKGKE